MSNQATFKESSAKRAWYKRMTPIAWVLVAVVAVSCLAFAVIGGGWAVPKLFASEEWATKTPTPTATGTPEPTEGPTPTPTEWWEGDATATLEATEVEIVEPFPAWWADEMVQDDDGQYWPPDEVVETVKDAWYGDVEAINTYLVDSKPPDYDAYEEAANLYYAGPQLEKKLRGINRQRAGEIPVVAGDYGICLVGVQEFHSNGVACTMSIACQNGTVSQYDSITGELQSERFEAHSGLVVYKMVYDPHDGHWKRYDVAEFIPAPEE
jgi:hypothetical protein